jgi:uncharacterized protein (DUF4213/DUF364 family)
MMKLFEELLATLPDGAVQDIRIGAFWTAVVIEVLGQLHCGLASTIRERSRHHHGGGPAVRDAGVLLRRSAQELAALVRSTHPMESALGMATINALLPRQEAQWVDINAGEVIAQHGAGKRVALVGHFPFIPTLRKQVGSLTVLEQQPTGQDLPAKAAVDVVPQADVVAITGTTLLNHTFEGLIALCRPDALVLVLGPSTPLSPLLFEYGVDLLSGSVVEDVAAVLRAVSQGANFRQVHRHGVRLVTLQKEK